MQVDVSSVSDRDGLAHAITGKSDEEIMAANPDQLAFIQQVQGFRILRNHADTDDQVSMTVYFDGADNWQKIQMKRFQNEWKIFGKF